MIQHKVTCTDEQVRGYRGTVARCICGWYDAWTLQGGNAEASGHEHMRANDAEYRARSDEQKRVWAIEREEREIQREAERLEHLVNTPLGPERKPREHCHDCSCFIDPPCNQCVDCRHIDIDDCPNDCQDCEIDHNGLLHL